MIKTKKQQKILKIKESPKILRLMYNMEKGIAIVVFSGKKLMDMINPSIYKTIVESPTFFF